jgi:8-oxo-dGTP pyrophosphatase MutT (NUDIX family)
VVVRQDGLIWKVALLCTEHKRGPVWVLPKGHIEQGETREQAAVREVQEETGYAEVTILADLGSYTHTFYDYLKDREVTRTESYFLMQLDSEQTYTGPQYAHENFQRKWVKRDEAERLTTYESEREFIRRARRALTQQA